MSTFIVAAVLAIVIFFWYPSPFFRISGAMDVIKVLVFVDLVLGPLLTLILFRPGKRGLKFDMACVFAMQISALLYGAHTVYEERPYYTVFVLDRFEVLARKDVDEAAFNEVKMGVKPWMQPIFVVATLPDSLEDRQRVMEETLFEGKPDIHKRPEYWGPYEQQKSLVERAAKPLSELLARRPDQAAKISAVMSEHGAQTELTYLPITSKQRALTLLMDTSTWLPVGVLDIDPWEKMSANAYPDNPS